MNQENNTPAKVLTLEQKQANWSKFAVEVHSTELRLQAVKEGLVAKLTETPYDTSKIEHYEGTVKEVKAAANGLVEDRKLLTNKLEKLKERLMGPEKELVAAVSIYETGLLQVKKTKRDNDAVVSAKAAEVSRVKEFFANSIAQQHAAFETVIINKVSKAYEQALTKKLSGAAVSEVWLGIKAMLNESHFTTKQDVISVVYMKPEEIDGIYTDLHAKHAKSANTYVDKWHKTLAERFEFYEIALKNAEASLELDKQNQAAALTEIAAEASDAQVAAKLEAISTVPDIAVSSGGRSLKQVYKLEMEETEQSAITIIAAFAANWSTVKGELGVRKWFNLSVKQMADGLVTLKNKDNRFEVSGIKFVLTDKL